MLSNASLPTLPPAVSVQPSTMSAHHSMKMSLPAPTPTQTKADAQTHADVQSMLASESAWMNDTNQSLYEGLQSAHSNDSESLAFTQFLHILGTDIFWIQLGATSAAFLAMQLGFLLSFHLYLHF